MEEILTEEAVLALPDDQFEVLLTSQLSADTRQIAAWEILRSPSVVDRSRKMLEVLHQRTTSVMQNKVMEINLFKDQCDLMGPAGVSLWREERPERMRSFNASAKFQRLVEGMQLELGSAPRGAPVRRPLQALQALVSQIVEHQKEMSADPSSADDDLWAVLDSAEVVLGNRRVTLRQAHEAGWK